MKMVAINNGSNVSNGKESNKKQKLEFKTVSAKNEANKEEINPEIEEGSFEKFNLPKDIIEKLKARNITYLYPVQSATLQIIRDGSDVVVQARTGTGKTYGFGIPIVEKLQSLKSNELSQLRSPKVLILAPTRELARQICTDIQSISTKLKIVSVYGGVRYEVQEAEMNNGVDIVTGTPGRILDLVQSGALQFNRIDYVVLDEVDRMLDMGFQDSVEDILKNVYTEERKIQTLFFSATCPDWVRRIAKKYMCENYKFIDLIGDSKLKTALNVDHLAIQCSYHDRASTIGTVLQVYSGKHGRAMIFCQTKKDADELACSTEIKQESHVLHGDIPQDKRELVLQKFRSGKYRVLITTDVAARGLDIPEVDLVICCSPPNDYESYVHRSGRTGRAGRGGTCVCFYKPQELNGLLTLEKRTGIKFKRVGAPGTAEIIQAAITDAVRSLDTVSDDLIEKFHDGAEEVLKGKEAVVALAAALALISGCTKVTQRSLLTSKENYTTYHLYKTDEEIRGKSFAFAVMKKCLGEENVENAINKVCCTKDRMGLVFDVASEYDQQIESKWYNTKSLELKQITELPELEEDISNYGNRNGSRNGGNRGFNGGQRGGGGGNRQNGGGYGRKNTFRSHDNQQNGGFKRKFETNSNNSSNKKIKFDD